MLSLEIGSLFDNKYELLEKLGSGGLGVVYKALQLDCRRIVALKIIKERHFQIPCSQRNLLQESGS